MKIKIIVYSFFLFLNVGNCLAQTLFTENMESPSISPTSIAANIFKNSSTLTYSNGAQATAADIRTTNPSSGYLGASGGGNVWFPSTSGAYGFSIEGVNASSYSSLSLEFGYRKESATAHATFSVDYWNGSSWITIANTATTLFNQTTSAASAWYLSKTLSLPSEALINGLKIRFVKTGATAIRIDDVRLFDTMFSQVEPICSGTTISPLPTITSSGITGTWSPVLDNTATTTYTFTPDQGQNARSTTMTIVVNPLPTATISGTTSTCINFTAPIITFTGLNGTSNYKFTYKINNESPLTITSAVGSATATLTVPTSTARTDVYTLLSVEDVKTTCSQSQTGTATITIDVCTALITSLRGTTLGDLNSPLSVSAVTGATTYRYEVTNMSTNVVSVLERSDSNRTSFSLNLLHGAPASPIQTITYGTTYSIRVAINNGNYVYGPAYTVTTPVTFPTCKLANKYCGIRLVALDQRVDADNNIFNAKKYMFRVNGGGIVNEEIVLNSYIFLLTYATQAPILYDTVYTVEVKVSVDGINYPTNYGTKCTLTTPITVPTSFIVSPDRSTTLPAFGSILYAQAVFGVNLYRFEISGGTLGTRVHTTTNSSFRLTQLLPSGVEYNTTYTVRVAVSLDNGATWGPFGYSCSYTTMAIVPSAPILSSPTSTSLQIAIKDDLNPSSTKYAFLETSTGKYLQNDGNLGINAVYLDKATWGIDKTVVNLNPVTTYSFKTIAQNNYGANTIAGPSTSLTTLDIPNIILPTGTLSALNTVYGTASTASSFSISGANLTGNIVVTPPAGFEVSQTTDGTTGYASSQMITPSSGSVPSTTLYIRLAATAASGTYSGDITFSSASDVLTVNLATTPSSVTKLDASITGVTALNKVCDGTTIATLSGTPSLNGVLSSDSTNVMVNTGAVTANFADAIVGSAKTVTVSGYTLSGSASSNYNLIQPSGLTANITANASSDIIFNTGSPTADNTNVNYKNYQNTVLSNTGSGNTGSVGVMGFFVRDGGASGDADALNTALTAISFSVTNASNLRSARLFVSTSPRGVAVSVPEPVNGISTIVFRDLINIVAPDNGQLAVNLRVTFKSTVTDNQQMQFTISSVTANSEGSNFGSLDGATTSGIVASSSTYGDINRIEVTADRLTFVQNPSDSFVETNMSPSPSVAAIDLNGNRDLDFSDGITITSSGTLSSLQMVGATNGLVTFNDINHTTAGTGLVLTSSAVGLLSNTSSTFVVNSLIVPTFNPVTPICKGAVLDILPTSSLNGIIGSWSPELNNNQTTTYTFTPNAGQNAENTTVTIIVNSNNSITLSSAVGTDLQTICANTAILPIIYSTSGATNISIIAGSLPLGVSALFADGVYTISGTPTIAGTYSFTIATSGGCETASINISITVVSSPTSAILSGTATICEDSNTNLNVDITGNSASYKVIYNDGTDSFTENNYISGSPISVSPITTKTFSLISVSSSEGCLGSGNSGIAEINVTPNNISYELTSEIGTNQQSTYINNAINNISYSTADVASATFEGLPDGVIGNFNSNTIIISGTPLVTGNFTYSITLTGNCGSIVTTGTLTVHSPENVNYCINKEIQFSFEPIDPSLSYTWSAVNSNGIIVNTATNTTGLYSFTASVPDNYTIKLVASGVDKCETVFTKNITTTFCELVVDCETHFNFNFKLPLPGSYFGGSVLNAVDRVNIANGVIDFVNSKYGSKLLLTTYDDTEASGARTTFIQSKATRLYDPIMADNYSEFGTNRFLRIQNNNYDDTFNKIITQPSKGILNNPNFLETNPQFKKMDISFFIMSEDQFTNPESIQNSYNQLLNSGKTKKIFFIFVEEGKFKDISSGEVNNPIQFMFWLKAEEMRLYDRDNPESKILDTDFVLFSKQEIADLGFRNVLNAFLQKAYSEISTSKTECQVPVSCTISNTKSPKIKSQLVTLVNKLLHEPKEKIINGYTCQELAIFSPFVNTVNSEKPAIYNFVHDTIKGYVAFSFVNHPDYDVKIATNESTIAGGTTVVADFNLDKYQSKESITLLRSASNDTFESYVRNIDFCSDAIYCQSHIAIVVDESGSIDATEANKIKKQLKNFIAKQEEDNRLLQSNIYISLTGLSDSDTDKRGIINLPDRVEGDIPPLKISSTNLSTFNDWIDKYGSRYGKSGISAGSDYWKSGLDKVLSYGIKPNIVLLITDGCQTADKDALQATLANFDNFKSSSNTSSDKPHLYIVGIENGYYVDDETTMLPHDKDPNYNPEIQNTTSNTTSPPFLQKSLQFLLGYNANEFPVSSIDNFANADYYGHENFNLLASDDTYFSDKLSISNYVCGEPAVKDFCDDCFSFQPKPGEEYLLSAWVKEESNIQVKDYLNPVINIFFYNVKLIDVTSTTLPILQNEQPIRASGDIIDGWQRIVKKITVPEGTITMSIELENKSPGIPVYFDDIRIHPLKGSMKTFVYDPETFKLMSELDENNYSTFYEYDNEGGLVRVKKETAKGVKTIQETRSGSKLNTN